MIKEIWGKTNLKVKKKKFTIKVLNQKKKLKTNRLCKKKRDIPFMRIRRSMKTAKMKETFAMVFSIVCN